MQTLKTKWRLLRHIIWVFTFCQRICLPVFRMKKKLIHYNISMIVMCFTVPRPTSTRYLVLFKGEKINNDKRCLNDPMNLFNFNNNIISSCISKCVSFKSTELILIKQIIPLLLIKNAIYVWEFEGHVIFCK